MKRDKNAKAKSDKSAKDKLPSGTPKSCAKDGYTPSTTTDPPVPNRAHTEM